MNRLFLASLLSALFVGLGQSQRKFSSAWASVSICQDGKYQSPIDIADCDAIHNDANVVFKWAREDGLKSVTMKNNGETAFLTGDNFTEHTDLDNGNFTVNVINVHWGSPGQKGSEHAVDGVKYDGELEIVLLKDGFTEFETAFDQQGNAIVVSVFLEEDSTLTKDIEVVNDFKASLAGVVEIDTPFTIQFTEKTLSLACLLPVDKSFYRYIGSISVTPCTEGIERIVFKNPIKVTPSFFTELRKLKAKTGGLLESSVNRPLQEDNESVIYKSWE